MSGSHHFTTMSLEQAKNNCRKLVTHFLTYFTLSQNVSGKASLHVFIFCLIQSQSVKEHVITCLPLNVKIMVYSISNPFLGLNMITETICAYHLNMSLKNCLPGTASICRTNVMCLCFFLNPAVFILIQKH